MKRLREKNINTPEFSDELFIKRWRRQVHYIDFPRFQLLASKFKGGKYLDIGCFNSPMPYDLTIQFPDAQIHAIDHAPEVIKRMQDLFPEVQYRLGDITQDLLYKKNTFDYIVAGELIEHLENPNLFIHRCMKVLKHDGWLALSTPHEDQGGITEEHLWSFTVDDIRAMLEPFGYTEVNVHKDRFDVITAFCHKR